MDSFDRRIGQVSFGSDVVSSAPSVRLRIVLASRLISYFVSPSSSPSFPYGLDFTPGSFTSRPVLRSSMLIPIPLLCFLPFIPYRLVYIE